MMIYLPASKFDEAMKKAEKCKKCKESKEDEKYRTCAICEEVFGSWSDLHTICDLITCAACSSCYVEYHKDREGTVEKLKKRGTLKNGVELENKEVA